MRVCFYVDCNDKMSLSNNRKRTLFKNLCLIYTKQNQLLIYNYSYKSIYIYI